MTERPRDRRTVLVWWITVATMVVIAMIFLLIQSPWNDPTPGRHHKARPKPKHSTSAALVLPGADTAPRLVLVRD